MTTRVLIIDDHLEARERFRVLLQKEPDIELAGEALDGTEALDLLKGRPVDVAVVDHNLPKTDGVEITKLIHADRPGTKVLVVSMQAEPHYVKKTLEAGATGYMLKDCAFEELVEAVHKVASGGTHVSPEIEMGEP